MKMDLDLDQKLDSFMDGTKEVAETAHEKTNEFHKNYVSHYIPDCGKYGDEATFVAELVPGVAEYNAIREGDWQSFAISAGIDVAAIGIGLATMGTGYAATKGASAGAKAGVKVATKELAEAGVKKGVNELAEAGVKKGAKELAEAGAKKGAKELVETGAEQALKETAEKVVKETAEAGTKQALKETVEEGTKKGAKELADTAAEKVSKTEVFDRAEQIIKNKLEGTAREEKVLKKLLEKYDDSKVIREAFIRDANGLPIKDIKTGEARRIDFIITDGKKVIESIEVTSPTADKILQIDKERRILEQAWDMGGAFIKDPRTGELIEFTRDIVTEIRRL